MGLFMGVVSTDAEAESGVPCAELDDRVFSAGTATRTCAQGSSTFGDIDYSGCTKIACAEAEVGGVTWGDSTVYVGTSDQILCHEYDASKYEVSTDQYATLACLVSTGAFDVAASIDVS